MDRHVASMSEDAVAALAMSIESSLQSGVQVLVMEPGSLSIVFPAYPIHDHSIEIYVETDDKGKIVVHDAGNTEGELIINGMLCNDDVYGSIGKIIGTPNAVPWQSEMITRLCKYHGVSIGDKDDVLRIVIEKGTTDEIVRAAWNLLTCILQIYAIEPLRWIDIQTGGSG